MGNTFGYISGYNLKSDGSFSGINNSLDSTGKNTNVPVNTSVFLFKNVWGISSPNQNDQILVMTNDSEYISANSYLTLATGRIYTDYFGILTNGFSQSITYISLYFILVFGLYGNSAKTSKQFVAILQMLIPSTALVTNQYANVAQRPIINLDPLSPSSTPSYVSQITTLNKLGSSELLDRLIRDLYLYYIVCTDLATNGSKSSYYNILDPNQTIISENNIQSSDWTYAANYLYTIYTLAPNLQSNFCITYAPVPSEVKRDDSPLQCSSNKSASSLINTPSGPYGQGGAAAWAVNNKMNIIYIVVALLLCCCCCISIVFVLMASSAKKKGRRHGGTYYNLD
jgi:hypothetical protein